MPERGEPNLALRRRLGAELRRLRKHIGLTGDEVASRLGWPSSSKLSRVELGQVGLKQPDLERLLDLYRVTGTNRDELTALAEESRRAGLASRQSLPGVHVTIAEDEAEAESIRIWQPQIVPGLFQTESYARALFERWVVMFAIPYGEVDRRIEARKLRQRILTGEPAPLVTAVIDESVLHRRVGDASVMHEQLEHIGVLSRLANIDVRILTLDSGHIGASGPFSYLRFRRIHAIPRVDSVAVEHLTGTQYLEDETNTHQYSTVFEWLLTHSLDQQESRSLLDAALARWASMLTKHGTR